MTVRNQQDLEKTKKILFDDSYREDYINSTYNYGLKFCKGYENANFEENLHKKMLDIVCSLLERDGIKNWNTSFLKRIEKND